jgi:hypothetical protein
MARARDPNVEALVLAAFWENYFADGMLAPEGSSAAFRKRDPRMKAVFAHLERDLAALTANGKRVFIVLSNPTLAARDSESAVPRRLAGFIGKNVPPVIAREAFVSRVAPLMAALRDVAARSGATVIDPVDFLCDGDGCATVTPGGVPVFRDFDHLRAG